ncbi:hypothetical protein WJX75_008166 [Coccomyxa subellipsoidea]|uniref:Vacuolar import/degradation Vid27 C-terminal domain-containing protein n=1 Tax=Coccomyxa subellipsoidea TaxID=248742 RepID=A0ABR2YKX8_9CHLO
MGAQQSILEEEAAQPEAGAVPEADKASAKPQWFLEAGELEVEVTDKFSFEQSSKRATFAGASGIWALRFPSSQAFQNFINEYNGKLFENIYNVKNDEGNREKVFGKDSVLNLGAQETAASREQWLEDVDMEEAPSTAERFKDKYAQNKNTPIKGVRMGAGDRSYLVRDDQIEVLKNVYGGVQDTGTSFKITPRKGGSTFTPSKLMLMNRERRMNMLSPDTRTKLFNTDIETGKIVNEWSFKKDGTDVEIKDIVNDTRAGQLTDEDTFLGIGQNRLARWDMRDPTGIVQDSPVLGYQGGKDYASKVNFNCMATSGDGYIVVGSEDGQIRMYSERSLTRANTAIPGLGAPISAVDVTYDGKWVLATTRNYLMVVKTTYKDAKEKETNGFKSRMGSRGAAPRLLRLKAEDAELVGGAPLQKGKFTWITESGREERWIVASCGNYTVLWNFRQVKLATNDVVSYGGLTTCTSYHLIPKQESVVDSVFMADKFTASPSARPGQDESSMVIVTSNNVFSLADDE